MSVLSDEQYLDIAAKNGILLAAMLRDDVLVGDFQQQLLTICRAVADAAIAADRAARAEPVAWMHNQPGRVDVISKPVKELLERQCATYGDTGHEEGLHRPVDKVKHYTIPLYAAPPAAPVATTEEGRHCGDPDCVPCRDPAEPAAPVVPEGWRNAAEKGLLALNQAVNLNQLGWQEAELVKQGRAELSAMLAAHEAKRASCSQTAKKSTHEGGRVDETGKNEHVGGAA